MKKSELSVLRFRIAALAEQGRAIGRQIREASGRARYDLWNDKRSLGDDARALLLAYAFLRDVPYRVVEPTAVTPSGWQDDRWQAGLAARIEASADGASIVAPKEQVQSWLAVPETEERREARQLGHERSLVELRARRAARKDVQGAA